MKNKRVLVGMIEFGTPEMSSEALCSAVLNAGMGAQYFVVFNPPGDSTKVKLSWLRGKKKPRMWVKQNRTNVGFTKAANQILKFDERMDVVLVNTDMLFESDWLKELHRAAYAHPQYKVGMVAPRIDNKILYRGHEGRQTCGVTDSECDGQPTPYEGVFQGWFGFACAYFRRDMLDNQGYLDEHHKNYQSDKLYCRKISRAGYWIVHTHASVVHHIGLGSGKRKGEKFTDDVRAKCLPKLNIPS